MNEHAGREKEIEARHHACSYLPSAVEICTVCFLLAQLREARKKLAEVEELAERIRLCAAEAGSPKQAALLTVLLELDRILKGGD